MRSILAPGVALSILFSACASGPEPERFGKALELEARAIPVAELLATPERFDGTNLRLMGTVAEVCAKKGCWMTLAAGERELRMTFQDYGFFVPLDASGARVEAEGVFRIEETPVDEARHYLEDAGRDAEAAAITSPVRGFTFVASGVELTR